MNDVDAHDVQRGARTRPRRALAVAVVLASLSAARASAAQVLQPVAEPPREREPWPAPPQQPGPFERFESPSLMVRLQSLGSTAHADEWRLGGAFEYGTPGPGLEGQLQTGLAIRAHLDGGWIRVGDRGGGFVAPGVRFAVAWAGEARSTDVAFGFGALVTPVISFVDGAERLSLAVEPGIMLRFHVFGLTAGTPLELETYGWNDGPWKRGAFGGGLAGVSIAAGLFIPGNRW